MVLQENIGLPVGGNCPVKTDVRFIAATNDDLLRSVEQGNFREDLYHRLNEFRIDVPLLRERGNDLDLFIRHFTAIAGNELGQRVAGISDVVRSEEHTSELQSLMRISYAVFCLNKKINMYIS